MSVTSQTMTLMRWLQSPGALEQIRTEQGRRDFRRWLPMVTPAYTWDWRHLLAIQAHLDRVTRGEIDRLMLFLPPRHGKSEMTTIRYPVWRLEREPGMRVIIGAYNQTLANKFSRKARAIARQQLELSEERTAAEDWETAAGGGLRAVGVGGGITGQGGHLIVIDDPVKSREEANSEAYRERVWDWYTDDLYTRLEPGGAIVLIMTRWHEDDLAGRIMASEEAPDWTVLSLPAFAEPDDPLGRAEGEALCPERYDVEALERIRQVLGHSFYALYQQRPQPLEGGMFQQGWFEIVPAAAQPIERVVRYWDKAGTADGGAYTVGVAMTQVRGLFYVLDVVRGQWTTGTRETVIKQTAYLDRQAYGQGVETWVEQEPGSGGKESAEATIRNLAGFTIKADRPTGDKTVRAEPYAAQAEAGNVKLRQAEWNGAYLSELTSFPTGQYADQVDASSGAFNKLNARSYGPPGTVRYA
jgi:predicted phage terminase large subunit-like protein